MVEAIRRNTPTGKFLAQVERMRTDPHKPLLGVGRDYEFDSVDVAFNLRPLNDQTVVLQSLSAANPRAGEGSEAMRILCTIADRCGVTMLLSAGPYSTSNAEAMSRDRLMAWYSRFGFVSMNDPDKPSEMRREPQRS